MDVIIKVRGGVICGGINYIWWPLTHIIMGFNGTFPCCWNLLFGLCIGWSSRWLPADIRRGSFVLCNLGCWRNPICGRDWLSTLTWLRFLNGRLVYTGSLPYNQNFFVFKLFGVLLRFFRLVSFLHCWCTTPGRSTYEMIGLLCCFQLWFVKVTLLVSGWWAWTCNWRYCTSTTRSCGHQTSTILISFLGWRASEILNVLPDLLYTWGRLTWDLSFS